jgi:hypothetical protein
MKKLPDDVEHAILAAVVFAAFLVLLTAMALRSGLG